jgi:hypothetical protein
VLINTLEAVRESWTQKYEGDVVSSTTSLIGIGRGGTKLFSIARQYYYRQLWRGVSAKKMGRPKPPHLSTN